MKGVTIGRMAGILAIIIARFRSIPAHSSPDMLANDTSAAVGECIDNPPWIVRTTAKAPVLFDDESQPIHYPCVDLHYSEPHQS